MGERTALLAHWAAHAPRWLLRHLLACRRCRALARVLAAELPACRAATASDAAGLATLYGYGRTPELGDPAASAQRQIEDLAGRGHLLVTDAGRGIVGAVTLVCFDGEDGSLFRGWWIFGLVVEWRHRGRGVGEGLMRAALHLAADAGAPCVSLLVFADNRPAASLYRKLGFHLASMPGLDEQLDEEVRAGHRRRVIMSRPAQMPGGPSHAAEP